MWCFLLLRMAAVEPVLLPQDLVPHHYDLSLVPDLETCTFTCDEEVHVTVKNETNCVTLHSREITVDKVEFFAEGQAKGVAVEEIQYAVKAHTVKFIFEKTLPVGKGKLVISYRYVLMH
ncbi:hypothetical protein EON63_03845 [archaeon]|nr:MAG: hypothetical protein EON63_03845 [archaeon]